MNIGDRVVFINDGFPWFGEQFTVTSVDDSGVVRVLDDLGVIRYFIGSNLKILAEDPSNRQASGMCSATILDKIKVFTLNHKNLEISFEDGMITIRDWDIRHNQPMDYRCDTIEQLEELMGAWEMICKFKVEI